MDAERARRRFTAAPVARLATVDPAGHPRLVPVVFAAYAPQDALGTYGLVTAVDHEPKRTTRLARLADIGVNPAVSLLVDAYGEDWDRLWWARADGTARIVPPDAPDPAVRERHETARALLRGKYPQYRAAPPGGPVLDIAVDRWSGWQAAAPAG